MTVTVDGIKVKPIKICNGALIGVNLIAGTHTVEFSYTPKGLWSGIIITLLAIAAFVCICLKDKFKYLIYAAWGLTGIATLYLFITILIK